ncbi:TIGR01777 family oxidoreductase [Desulforegula conservatrix]|uniref:TIGR01777 family oxidoreductase n=1 Tax=Desulforegula conservatrix TaxID=153026 RepID=UPI000424DDFD|nr:TIGR01777 family oxidoreductase [Desulforegula conservatrix]
MKKIFRYSSIMDAPKHELFSWHERDGALERLSPPWDPLKIIRKGGISPGSITKMIMHEGPVPYRWTALHTDYEINSMFRDIQIHGPLKSWRHTHIFSDSSDGKCLLTDEIELEAPFSYLGDFLLEGKIRSKLTEIFRYRHELTTSDISRHMEFKKKHGTWKILISGASGLIGSNLAPFFTTGGHEVYKLVRRKPFNKNEIFWNPSEGIINSDELEGFDAIIHLAGENIGDSKWTPEKKKVFIESRTKGTALLAKALNTLKNPPKVFISASATGFYGDRGDIILSEKTSKGNLFISDLCDAWEKSASDNLKKSIRLVIARIGVVLTPEGGALSKMLPVFKAGFGGKTGNGNQYMAWISMDDVIGAIYHIMLNDSLTGKVNLVAPEPVTNKMLVEVLSKILKRPAFTDIPEIILKAAFGQMADEILLASSRVIPSKLLGSGYVFLKPDLETALRHTLGRTCSL